MLSNKNIRFYRWLTLAGYLPLLAFVVAWHFYLVPHPHLSQGLVFILFILPLLLPLWGIIQAKPYTHAWANFVLMLYFLHGFTVIYTNPELRILAVLELILTSMAFIGATYYARHQGRALNLGIKKTSHKQP